MSQLDRLIGALFQHSADALQLAPDQQPALLIGGSLRTVVKRVLDGEQVGQLLREITPEAHQQAIGSGEPLAFHYDCGENTVLVEIGPGPSATIRPRSKEELATPQPTTPPAAPRASVRPLQDDSAETEAPAVAPPAPTKVQLQTTGELTMPQLFQVLVDRGGSDLHVSSEAPPMLRMDGEMAPLDCPALDAATARRILLDIAPQRNKEEFAECGDTDFAYAHGDICRIRCNLFMDRKGPGGVFRVIPTEILTAEDLKLSKEICDLAFLTKGLVLVTGPTGSGKSTTLAALIDLVNRQRTDHVITIEDPIEFVHPNHRCLINQREVHLHTSGFKKALRAALREDPDVVLVGEMRDLETIAIAIETAETGHLVFGTLHTSSAVSTVDRIIDQFPGDQQGQIRVMLSESLKSVIAQVLCRKIGGGRCPAFEVLMVNPAVSNLIREGKTFQIPSIMQTGKKLGMQTLNAALLELVQKKMVEPQEAYLKAIDKQSLVTNFRAKNIRVDFLDKEKSKAG